MKYFSMFSGIGGFELGIQNAFNSSRILQGINNKTGSTIDKEQLSEQPLCVGYSEIDKYAIKIYERHFKHENYGDATTIIPTLLPDFELLVGGFPCQSFSIAGKRRGFKDTRGTLFFDIARILDNKRPRHLVLENVKGLLSHDGGKTFQIILGILADLGYRVEWQILNSKDFGVPQNRERVYIVGHLRNECTRKIFPIVSDGKTYNDRENRTKSETKPASAITTREGGRKENNFINVVGNLNNETWSKRHESIRRVHGIDGISPTIPTGSGGGVMTKVAIPVLTPGRPIKRQNGRRMKNNGEPAFTLTVQDIHGIYDGARIRRLTPRECERLQGFPDNWTIGESDTQRYKMCGNAVTVNTVSAVMNGLILHNVKK